MKSHFDIKRVADLGLKTLTGRDNEESLRELREKLKGVEPFENDEALFAHAREMWEKAKAEQRP